MNRNTAKDTLCQGCHHTVAVLEGGADETTECATVFLVNNDVVRNVHQTAGQITCVGSLEGGVGKTLTGTVGRDKVFEH